MDNKLDIGDEDGSEHSDSNEEVDFDARLEDAQREGEKQKEMLKDLERNPAEASTSNIQGGSTNEVDKDRKTFIQAKTWKKENT